MTSTAPARLALPALALALALTACGDGGQATATSGSASDAHRGGHSTDTAEAGKADIAFLAGMKPHHEQAVEMSDIVLAADPPAPVADLAREIKAAQAPEIAEMDALLADLGADTTQHDAGHGAGHGDAHGGMLSEQELAALRGARGSDAARLFLEGMVAHHRGAVEASAAVLADGGDPRVLALARRIQETQAAEIERMEQLLAGL